MTKRKLTELEASVSARLSKLAREHRDDFQLVEPHSCRQSRADRCHVALLARVFDFDGELLSRAIRATFERRGTPVPLTTPIALSAVFAEEPSKRSQWSGFSRKANVGDAGTLAEAVHAVQRFVLEPLQSVANGTPFIRTWRAGGPWRFQNDATP